MAVVHQKLALAEQICNATQLHPFWSTYEYVPLYMLAGPASWLRTSFYMDPFQIKPFAFAAQLLQPFPPLLTHPPTLQSIAQQHYTQQTSLY